MIDMIDWNEQGESFERSGSVIAIVIAVAAFWAVAAAVGCFFYFF